MWSAQFELMLHEFKLGCVLIQLDECILEEATFLLRQKKCWDWIEAKQVVKLMVLDKVKL